MSNFEDLKKRIGTSLHLLNDVLSDYERIALKKRDLSQKINLLKSEHLNDLNELNSIIREIENLVGDREND